MRVPLRLRLVLVVALASAALLAGLGSFVLVRLHDDLIANVDLGLRSRADVVAADLAAGRLSWSASPRTALLDPDEAFAQVLDRSGRVVASTRGTDDPALLSAAEVGAVQRPTSSTLPVLGDDPVRLLAVPASTPHGAAVVVVGSTLGDVLEATDRMRDVLLSVSPVALLAAVAGTWLLAGAALRPVERLRSQAAAASVSEPDRRLPVPRTGDELERLGVTLDGMLARLQRAVHEERRFTDSASHELRTPLASLRTEIELALARPRSADQLRSALESAGEDVARLQRLADDLLSLARVRGALPVRRRSVPLSQLVERSRRAADAAARAAGVTLVVDTGLGAADVDPDRVDQALRNLLDNAVRATPPGGRVHLQALLADGAVELTVADTGPGFPPDLLPCAFEPFVRGDRSALGPDGAGLGLPVVRALAEVHGGRVEAENGPDGAVVTLLLPAGRSAPKP